MMNFKQNLYFLNDIEITKILDCESVLSLFAFSLQKISLFFFITPLFFLSCATYQNKISESRNFLQQGNFDLALSKLRPLAENESNDQLIYLLDYSTALRMAGKYSESNKNFLEADKFAELQDYHSVSKVAGSMLFNEEMVQYKGDTFEKIFINAYVALNYLELGDLERAAVQARRINEKFTLYRTEEKQKFELNPFSKYLTAVIWEAEQNWDNAYISYSAAYDLDPNISGIHEDLIRTAKKSRRENELKKWKNAFPEVQEKPEWSQKNIGELVVFFEQGWGPRKDFSPADHRVPILRPTSSLTQRARLTIKAEGNLSSAEDQNQSFLSSVVYDTESAAIKTLQEDAASLLARRLAAFATKEIVSDQIRQKNELLGALSNIVMHVSERADLRQWSTLPQTIQVIRVNLQPGKYKISLQGLSGSGAETDDKLAEKEIMIKPSQKVFVNWRSLK